MWLYLINGIIKSGVFIEDIDVILRYLFCRCVFLVYLLLVIVSK